MLKKGFWLFIGLCFVSGVLALAQQKQAQPQQQQQPRLQEEVVVRWWLVPVYAVDKAGAPVLNLAPEDLEVQIKGIKVEPFSLIKKQFQVTETKKGAAPAPAVQSPAQKKMVFLVFDAAFTPYNLLAHTKAVAETVIAQSDKSAQYVLLSIEPYIGLKYIFGPSRDLKQLSKNLKKYVEGKKPDYMEASAMDNHDIFNVSGPEGPPNLGGGIGLSGRAGGFRAYTLSPGVQDIVARIDWRDKRRVASSYTSSLMTLDLVLGQFRDYSKVIYLYSCGIPGDALLNRTEVPEPGAVSSPTDAPPLTVYLSADTVAYDTLKMVGEHFNKSGALLFLVNPSGTRVDETDKDSGEQSLRILATESGGRYFEGAEKDISNQVNNMEGGYYEISFPDKPEYQGQELSFEIRSKKPDVQIFTIKKVGREKSYADMTELEREVTVMNILNEGPFSQTGQKVSLVPADALQDGDSLLCQVRLPEEIARSEWTVYKIARNFATGRMFMDKEVVVPTTDSLQFRMKWRGKEFHHDLVLAHARTGTILVWK
jgi:hypothetical protein